MTNFLAYDELTWPEVQALSRDIPMILPVGKGYSADKLAETMGNPEKVYMLPELPFGWQGSGLAVGELILGNYLSNIINSLRDDGFSNTLVVLPQGLGLDLSIAWAALPQPHNTSFEHMLPPDEGRGKVVLIPIGHTEQHGYHLPLSTDTIIINSIAQGVERLAPTLTTALPVMPYGVSTHRHSFAGTLNAGGRIFEDFWIEVIDGLVKRGFDRFYLISGHGGNSSFINNVVKYVGERHRRIFCATAWLYLSGPEGISALQRHRQSKMGGMGHAGELETSLMLHLKPSLVHMERVVDETDFVSTPSYSMDWVEGGALIANPPWEDDTVTGPYGAGSLASAEKGKVWLKAAIAEKVSHINEIHQQHQLREERRKQGFGGWGKKKSGQD